MAIKKKNNHLIFVVEDNQVYNHLVVSFLKSHGYTNVESYYTGKEAAAALDKKNPCIVIQDYLLGDISGLDVLKIAQEKRPESEFIFLSGNDSIEVAINTMKYGAYDYIVKDQVALKKLIIKIERITRTQTLANKKSVYKKGVIIFFSMLVLFIILVIAFVVMNPAYFGWTIR